MRIFRSVIFLSFLLAIGFPANGQEKTLNLKANFPSNPSNGIPAIVSKTEVNRLFAKRGYLVENKVYSTNGRIEARIEPPLSYASEYDDYNAHFTDVINGKSLGRFTAHGELFPANDGEHFVTFKIHSPGWMGIYAFTRRQPLRIVRGVDRVTLSGDGTKVLLAAFKDYGTALTCFSLEGETLWSRRLEYTNCGEIAISHAGSYAAISAFLLDPQKVEEQKRIHQAIEEAIRQWEETNRKRRALGLPPLPFIPPTFPDVKPKSVYDKLNPSRATIFLDANGFEIGRSVPSVLAFTDLVFSRDGGAYLAASNGSAIYLFDAASASVLQKKELQIAMEVNALDVSRNGELAVAAIAHRTKNDRGWTVDRGLADPRLVIWWDPWNSEMSSYTFGSDLQIPRDHFFVSMTDSAHRLLALAGDQIFVFEKPGAPREFSLALNFPNPFNPATTIRYALPQAGKVTLRIFNILGEEVHILVNGFQPTGEYAEIWDGKDNQGRAVASGIYLYQISYHPSEPSAEALVRTGKMSLVR